MDNDRRQYNTDYYQRNKDKLNSAAKRRYAKNPEPTKRRSAEQRRSNPQATAAYMKNYAQSEPPKKRRERWRKWLLSKKYGMTLGEYETMWNNQNGVCAICLGPPCGPGKLVLVVDHDHVTNKVRGLLCNSCNIMLGFAKDSAETLRRGVSYLGGAL